MGNDFTKVAKKILVLYDMGQLQPVGEERFFSAGQPDFLLRENSRQPMESPIIRLSMEFREGRMPRYEG